MSKYFRLSTLAFLHMKPGQYNHISDSEMLGYYYADGNQEWIGILLQRYTLLLLGVCMKYLKDETEARDAVQQVFLKVLTEVPKYKIEFFKSWLYMVAKNHCLMRLRDKGSKAAKELTDTHLVQTNEDESDLWQNEKTYALLEEAMEELNEEQKRCINLFYLQKKSYQQITDRTGFTGMQVKSYIQNGKRNLKIILERKLAQSNPHKK